MKIKLPVVKKNDKLFWVYLVAGILLILLAVVLMPVWSNVSWAPWKNWGNIVLKLLMALILSLYLFGYVLKKIIHTGKSTIKVLTIIEFTLLFLIDLYLILGQFGLFPQIIQVNEACAITGLALWIRGVVELFRAYYHQRTSSENYPVWWLCIAIAFVSVGMWMLVKPFFTNTQVVWVFVSILYALGIIGIVCGFYSMPNKKKK